MARNRMIKPEFCSDGKIGKLSIGARLLFILLWMHSDDFGVITSSERFILGNCFENDESVTNSMLKKWLNELVSAGFVVEFLADEKKWYFIKNWNKHQKVNRPSTRRNPPFSLENAISVSHHGVTQETLKAQRERERESKREREREMFALSSFEIWWEKYEKVGNRKPTFEKWEKLSDHEIEKCLNTVEAYVKSKPDKTYRLHGSTYLNKEAFNDEIQAPPRTNSGRLTEDQLDELYK